MDRGTSDRNAGGASVFSCRERCVGYGCLFVEHGEDATTRLISLSFGRPNMAAFGATVNRPETMLLPSSGRCFMTGEGCWCCVKCICIDGGKIFSLSSASTFAGGTVNGSLLHGGPIGVTGMSSESVDPEEDVLMGVLTRDSRLYEGVTGGKRVGATWRTKRRPSR